MQASRRYKKPTEERLKRSALHYLERYASSAANLQKVLQRKVFKACHSLELDPEDYDPIIDRVVALCVETGLINDLHYAETKAASMRRRGGSKRKIEAKLIAKGVDRDTLQNVLESDDEVELEAAIAFARRRRLGPYRKSSDRELRREKDLAAMCRAGFAFEVARQVIDTSDEIEHSLSGFSD
ncbi:RecX family transcriptional regulator [uncultured Roseibium sp.]|uniref:regulatory protein RecX n=1 Tax=uncultured Roseibium sp. TaxID=1936171 RepID=UPI00261D8211|nr:RecX family transcriptional regulator [uncultured Roseibium sp.]